MEMDGLDSAKCQKSRRMDMIGIKGIVNDNKTKLVNSFLPQFEAQKRQCAGGEAVGWNLRFLERESTFSLGFRPIRSSVLDGARSKVALCGEGYAWAPIWWSFDKSKR